MYQELWKKADNRGSIPLKELPSSIQTCLREGDGVYDHYGMRAPFLFLEQNQGRLLALELINENEVNLSSIINATGGYGTGILGHETQNLFSPEHASPAPFPCSNDEYHSLERYELIELIKKLVGEHTNTGPDDWNITFTSTGTEAMDFAFQLAQLEGYNLTTGTSSRQDKNVIVACRGAWHGWGLNANQLLDRRQFTDGLPRLANYEIVFLDYGDHSHLQEIFSQYKGKIKAVFVEGILGDGGIIEANRDWWIQLLKLAKEDDIRVCDDEILTCLRTGKLLGIPEGIAPDCITLGKALGFGLFPMSAVLWRTKSMNPRPGIGVRTFNARPWQASIVKKGLDLIIRNNLFSRAEKLGSKLIEYLERLPLEYPQVYKAVRGKGFMIGVELAPKFAKNGRQVCQELIRAGLLSELESGIMSFKVPKEKRINQTIRLTPPLTIPEVELEKIAESFYLVGQKLSPKEPANVN